VSAPEVFSAINVARDITEWVQADTRIRASLAEKETLLKEIHHRVNNNMQIVASLLSLQAGTVDDPQMRAQLKDSQNRIRFMALVHERLYRSQDLANIDFKEYLYDLEVESRLGSGTTFSVYLPALGLASVGTAASDESGVLPLGGNQHTILVVDDNAAARKSISGILELANYHVLTAANGREALAILDRPENKVDLILSELDMPEMDGLEVCRQLRARKINVNTMILSGYISDDVITELKSLTVAEFMSKPVDVDQLLERVEASWQMPPT
jgi:CheY-like chemotaxis protein